MNLVLQHDGSGYRHYLDGRPVHCGAQLLLKVLPIKCGSGAMWIWARYEAAWVDNKPRPMLYTLSGRVVADEGTFLRWPTEDER
jgi:hypothetical protein